MKILLVLFLLISKLTYSYINIYPVKFVERIDNEGAYKKFVLYNKSEDKVRYRFYFEKTNKKMDMSDWCSLSLTSLELEPLERKEIVILCKAPENVLSGRYTAKLAIKEVDVVSKDRKLQHKRYLTKLILNMVGYVGERGVAMLKSEELNLEGIKFIDINDSNLIFTRQDRTYIYNLEQKKIQNNYDGEILERVNDRYILKIKNRYELRNLDFYDKSLSYEEVLESGNIGTFIVKKDNKYGVINKDGKILIDFKYKILEKFKGEFSIYQNFDNHKKGIIDSKGKILLNPIFDELYITKNGNWLGKKKGLYFTSNMKVLKIDRIIPNKKDILVYEKDNKYGLINLFNLKFTENIYENISQEVDTGFIIENEGKYSLIKSGEFFENKIENDVDTQHDYIIKIDDDIYGLGNFKRKSLKYYNLYTGVKLEQEFKNLKKGSSEVVVGEVKDEYYFIRSSDSKIIAKTKKDNLIYINKKYILLKEKIDYKLINIQEI